MTLGPTEPELHAQSVALQASGFNHWRSNTGAPTLALQHRRSNTGAPPTPRSSDMETSRVVAARER